MFTIQLYTVHCIVKSVPSRVTYIEIIYINYIKIFYIGYIYILYHSAHYQKSLKHDEYVEYKPTKSAIVTAINCMGKLKGLSDVESRSVWLVLGVEAALNCDPPSLAISPSRGSEGTSVADGQSGAGEVYASHVVVVVVVVAFGGLRLCTRLARKASRMNNLTIPGKYMVTTLSISKDMCMYS